MEELISIKCIDFNINHDNSDAKCHDIDKEISKCILVANPKICNLCPYNDKFKDMTYKEWKEFEIKNQYI